ncbi:unnamed protein product [Rhizoctonia solani]|uniref:BTB domain-containing protein n=1 Tax=Rhizoctonia solani TaxID=456999 RepID=A0A8H3AAB1_9AGAM|nr:unnamed protein product [Rhizoctonia solani]
MSSPAGGKSSTQPLFVPPRGGDLTLRSSDGVEFLVHSTILKFASSVFDDMIATGTTKDTVELTENANDVSYLLRFIYPNKFPVSISLDQLPNCLMVVQKYDIEGALEIIEEIISLDAPPHKPLSSDPIRIYQLAVQFNLTKTKAAVAPLVAVCQTNFCDLSKLSEFSQTYPPLKLVHMMNLQAMRSKVLSDVLFDFENAPMLPADDTFFYTLSCHKCWHTARYKDVTEGCKQLPTTWSLTWARLAYKTLLTSSIDRAQFLFQRSVISKFADDRHACIHCLIRIRESNDLLSRFESWVTGVKKSLEMQLETLEPLYSI